MSDYLGLDESTTINTTHQLPKNYTLSRSHPYATDFLPDEEREQPDASTQG